MLKALWRYRHFVLGSIRNELVSRFARSKLGGLWMLINPLAQVAIYAWRDMALVFNVINIDKTQFVGCLWNEPRIAIETHIQ